MPQTFPPRPAHWLPHEPVVTVLDDSGDGFHEATLELGGRIVATCVVSDDASMGHMLQRFQGVIEAEFVREA